MEAESTKARVACDEYLALGPGRSLAKLIDQWRERGQSAGKARVTNRLATLERWSSAYGWQERAAAYDDAQRATIRAEQSARAADERAKRWGYRIASYATLRAVGLKGLQMLFKDDKALAKLGVKDLMALVEQANAAERAEDAAADDRVGDVSDDAQAQPVKFTINIDRAKG